jgi:hypothetical protein
MHRPTVKNHPPKKIIRRATAIATIPLKIRDQGIKCALETAATKLI